MPGHVEPMRKLVPLTRKAVARWAVGGAVSLAVVAAVVIAGRRQRVEEPFIVAQEMVAETSKEQPSPARSLCRPAHRRVAASAVVVVAAVSGITAIVISRPDGSACISNPTLYPDTTNVYVSGIQREVLLEDLPAPGRLMALGDPLELAHATETRHDVAVLGVDDLEPTTNLRPANGRRLVSVTLQERNMGQVAIIPQVGNYTWLCDADGTWYQHDAAMTGEPTGADRLEYRQKVVHTVVFQIRADARPVRVRTAATGEQTAKVADWRLD